MTLLNRYLLRRNIFLLLILLAIGTGIYILSELFQRIDVFLDAGHGVGMISLYFLVKLPIIISMILPAVFLLGLVLQFSFMHRSRETIALEAGGVSPSSRLRFVLFYGLFWALAQFAFSQVLGVMGERYSTDLWQNEVKKREADYYVINSLWFTRGNYVISLQRAWPNAERATGVTIYELTADGLGIERTFLAEQADTGPRDWTLGNVTVISPNYYSYAKHEQLEVPIFQPLDTFKTFEPKSSPDESTIGDLYTNIRFLEESGTNVELLRTELHGRFAYSASLIVMGLLALVITMRTKNLYVAMFASLLCTFLYFAASSFFTTLAEKGSVPPPVGAWVADLGFLALALGYLTFTWLHGRRHKL